MAEGKVLSPRSAHCGKLGSFNMQALACPRLPPGGASCPLPPARLGRGDVSRASPPRPALGGRRSTLGTPSPRMQGLGSGQQEDLYRAFVPSNLVAHPARSWTLEALAFL